jgi:tetratricopeptide (TPR) repeat protein
LSGTRTSLHRVAGEALEHMTDETVSDRLALLALHFGRSDDRERAIYYLRAAGDRARILYLNREAIHFYEDALGRLGNSGSDRAVRAEVLASVGSALGVLAEDEAALDSLRGAVDLEEREAVRADLWRQIAEIHRRRGTYVAAHESLARAEACLVGIDSAPELARIRIARSMLAGSRGADAEARTLAAEAVALLARLASVPLDRAAAYRAAGIAAARQGDLTAASDALGQALAAAGEGKDALMSATISLNLGTVLHLQGQIDEALKLNHQALEFHERIGAKRGVALASKNLGDLYWRDGEGAWNLAVSYWQRSLRVSTEIADQRGQVGALLSLAEAHMLRCAWVEAEGLVRRAQPIVDELEDARLRSLVARDLARIWAATRTE